MDRAIMRRETEASASVTAGYVADGRIYENYLSNDSWLAFKRDMEKNHPRAYEQYELGGGKELEERRVGKYTYPPKMASFGSSSRMIYNLMKENPDFAYEKKLTTVVGGMANLDGFLQTEEKCIFVEAKCREPYGRKNHEVAEAYRPLYTFLTNAESNNLTCQMWEAEAGKMTVRFFAGDKELLHFDMKQMLCHLLGVGAAYLQGVYKKKIDFVYLCYNPKKLPIDRHKAEICGVYDSEREEWAAVDFQRLFCDILRFLQERYGLGDKKAVRKIGALFEIRMCDQFDVIADGR